MTTITREQTLKIIEAADEVISALAGTNEDVHPGSDNMLRLWDDLNDRYAPPEVVRELARIVLASLESEPVLFQSCTRPTWNSGVPWTEWKERSRECYEDDLRFTDTPDHAGWIYKCRKLYTTPPAPIALEAIENAIEYIRSIAFHINEDDYHGKHIAYFMRQALAWLEGHSCSDDRLGKAENQTVHGNQAAESNRGNEWTGNPDIDNAIIMLDRIDTLENCDDDRIEAVKAVLRRLAGNSPVTPDGWISCSERMPVIGELNWRTSFPLLVTCEIGVIPAYYGFVRVNGNKHYGFMESLKYGDDSGNHPQTNEYDLISNVTHWMPLPEPPEQDGE
ncbi:TPA: DUF551 domain-containing protein [Escherichia coli]|nr:DUF551 domain-containing protein [Escherichia coli]HBA5859189.1 DUF551 domain-containing protein [Escherichia coli]HBC6956826.1 DUF551 domain-containing protein [Escherichia coli]